MAWNLKSHRSNTALPRMLLPGASWREGTLFWRFSGVKTILSDINIGHGLVGVMLITKSKVTAGTASADKDAAELRLRFTGEWVNTVPGS